MRGIDLSDRKKTSSVKRSVTGNVHSLRQSAEAILTEQGSLLGEGAKDPDVLLHELSVHQIELEIQNDELRASKDAAEASQEKYFQIYDLAPIGYAGLDRNGCLSDINLAGARMLGHDRTSCLGLRLARFVVAEKNGEGIEAFLRQAFLTGTTVVAEFRIIRDKEEDRIVRIEGVVPPDQEDEPPLCRVVLIDVTGQRAAEREAKEVRQHLETLLDSANGPIVVWDRNLIVTRFNRAFERLTGRPASTVIGKPVSMLFPDSYRESAMAVIGHSSGLDFTGVEIPVSTLENGIRTLSWNAATLSGPGGPTHTIAQGVDITDRKAADRELRRWVSELATANEALEALGEELRKNETELKSSLQDKEVLLAEIHHRVKNNLAAFISLLALDDPRGDTPMGRQLKLDLQNRARSIVLIHETLFRTKDFSNVDMDVYLANLAALVISSYASPRTIRTSIEAKGIRLDIARATPVGLIVNELLTNSLKYAWPDGFDPVKARGGPPIIGIRLVLNGEQYVLTIRDNGIGLPKDIDPASTTSLGLRLVTFLARHQLRAGISINRENGTEFVLRFPSVPVYQEPGKIKKRMQKRS